MRTAIGPSGKAVAVGFGCGVGVIAAVGVGRGVGVEVATGGFVAVGDGVLSGASVVGAGGIATVAAALGEEGGEEHAARSVRSPTVNGKAAFARGRAMPRRSAIR